VTQLIDSSFLIVFDLDWVDLFLVRFFTFELGQIGLVFFFFFSYARRGFFACPFDFFCYAGRNMVLPPLGGLSSGLELS
jgi:hypothetical protein